MNTNGDRHGLKSRHQLASDPRPRNRFSPWLVGVSFCLLCSFLLQPYNRVFASELEPESDTAIMLADDLERMITTDEAETEASTEAESPELAVAVETNPTPDPAAGDALDTESDPIDQPVSVVTADDGITETLDDPANTPLPIEPVTEPEPQSDTEPVPIENDQPEIVDEAIAPTETETLPVLASSTPTVTSDEQTASSTPTPFSQTTLESDTHMQFSKDDCTLVADGSYYCRPVEVVSDDRKDGLYALPDSDGDLEIYLQKNDDLEQLTFNQVDDASPYFDTNSNTIVWHRLIDDRYQIVAYDVKTGKETQLTYGSVNNMEPHRNGAYTVWQHWADNWEIMLHTGQETIRLTDDATEDIAPSIRHGLVIWQKTNEHGERTLELYAIKTGERTTITDSDNGSISNPRMVVVYESIQPDGEVVTKGYDLITGEITTLDTSTPDLPDSIPQPDETGETRALLQGKTGARDDVAETSDDLDPIEPVGSSTPSVEPGDLVIGGSTVSVATSTSYLITDPALTLDLTTQVAPEVGDEHTLIIEPFMASSTGTTTSIE